MSMLYISDKAARNGEFGLLCHFQENTRMDNFFLLKTDVTDFKETFTRFWIRMSGDFQMKGSNSSVQILELRTESGATVAGVSIGFNEGKGFYIYGSSVNDAGNRAFVPGSSRNYPLSFVSLNLTNGTGLS